MRSYRIMDLLIIIFHVRITQSQHPRHRIATLQNESPGTFADTGPLVGKSKSESWLGRINQHGR